MSQKETISVQCRDCEWTVSRCDVNTALKALKCHVKSTSHSVKGTSFTENSYNFEVGAGDN